MVETRFKKTEVGLFPTDWMVGPLLGQVQIIHGFGFESRYFCANGPFLLTTPGHFYESGGFRLLKERQKYYNGPVPQGYIFNSEDLVVAMTEQADGLLGSAALIPEGDTYLHNQRLGKVKLCNSEISKSYLYWVFNSNLYRMKVRETAAGTKVKHTSPAKLLEIPVPLPPTKSEQEAIAKALSDTDALIESLEALIQKKKLIKQGAMQELLTGKKRLPGFSGDWVEKRLGEVAEITMGRTPSRGRTDYWGTGFPWASISDLQSRVLKDTKESITPLAAQTMPLIPSGTLIMSFKLSIGRLAFTGCDLFSNEAICAFHNPSICAQFLYYSLQRIDFSTYGKQAVKGYTLNSESLRSVVVFGPKSQAEQEAIAAVLSDLDSELESLGSKLTKAKQVKQGMMQQLLTGKIRLI